MIYSGYYKFTAKDGTVLCRHMAYDLENHDAKTWYTNEFNAQKYLDFVGCKVKLLYNQYGKVAELQLVKSKD